MNIDIEKLRQAVKFSEKFESQIPGGYLSVLTAAAKKQLAAEEASKPREVRLEAGYCRRCGLLTPTAHLVGLADWVCMECRMEMEAIEAKRAPLRELENHLRLERCDAPLEPVCRKATAAADILKALRETVVPWLRKQPSSHLCSHCGGEHKLPWLDDQCNKMLRALGEEP